jgi:hypothetical protein
MEQGEEKTKKQSRKALKNASIHKKRLDFGIAAMVK